MKSAITLLMLILLAVVSGFYQEKLKISINYILDEGSKMPGFFLLSPNEKMEWIEKARVSAPFDYYHNHRTISWLYHFDSKQLSMLKWAVTGFFLLWFLLLNTFLLKALSVPDDLTRYLPWVYGILIAVALVVYALAAFSGFQQSAYTLSRRIMGALQSVIPALIIWPASRIAHHSGVKL
jgi:hypothetical protein